MWRPVSVASVQVSYSVEFLRLVRVHLSLLWGKRHTQSSMMPRFMQSKGILFFTVENCFFLFKSDSIPVNWVEKKHQHVHLKI